MGFIKGAGVFFLSIISIFLVLMLSFSFALDSFLYPDVYFKALENSGIYNSIESNLGAEELFFITMPAGGPKELVESLFSKFMSYLRSETDTLELKVQVDHEKLRNFFLDQVGNVPRCLQGQDPFGQEPCLPQGINAEAYLDAFLGSRNMSFFEKTEVDLVEIYGISPGTEGRLAIDGLREKISYYKTTYMISAILLIIVLTLIFLLHNPKINRSLRTIAIISFVSSFVLYMIIYALGTLRPENIFPMSDIFVISIYEVVKDVFSSKLTTCMAILLIVGVVSLIFSFVIRSKPKKVVTSK